jgi:hypothetical protein
MVNEDHLSQKCADALSCYQIFIFFLVPIKNLFIGNVESWVGRGRTLGKKECGKG